MAKVEKTNNLLKKQSIKYPNIQEQYEPFFGQAELHIKELKELVDEADDCKTNLAELVDENLAKFVFKDHFDIMASFGEQLQQERFILR